MALSTISEQRAKQWMSEHYDEQTRNEVQSLFDNENWKELEDRFYKNLDFGTGGLRGVMAAGTNRVNQYTIAQATQGLANYIRRHVDDERKLRAAIAHDSRNRSREFAEVAAKVLSGNGIKVFVFSELRPTPELSFAIRHLDCVSGIMLTASHNPKEYNGYKCYWSDGAQVVPPHDTGIIDEVKKVTDIENVRQSDFSAAKEEGMIVEIGGEVDRAYLEAVRKQCLFPDLIKQYGSQAKVVFTPLHGTGATLVPRALEQWGFDEVIEVEKQMQPDGNFPTAESPNPEEGAALSEAIEVAKQHDAELVMATDPDADRLGIAVREKEGQYTLVTGNQLGGMMAYYLCEARRELNRFPENPLLVTTVVTSDIGPRIAEHYGVSVEKTLTGFKWIGEKMRINDELRQAGKPFKNFFYGYEESYGYLVGDHARDKDAVVAACVTAEMACWARSKGMSLLQLLDRIHSEFGVFSEKLKSVYHKGKEGMEKIAAIMSDLREHPPKEIGGVEVVRLVDYQQNSVRDLKQNATSEGPGLPRSNVLEFDLADGSKILARPSGTEPKVKFYFNLCDVEGLPLKSEEDLNGKREALARKTDACMGSFMKIVEQ